MSQSKTYNKFFHGVYKLAFAFCLFIYYALIIYYQDSSSIFSSNGGGLIALMISCFMAILLTVFYLLISVVIPSVVKASSKTELKIDIILFVVFLSYPFLF